MAEFFLAVEQLVAKLRRDMINAREKSLRQQGAGKTAEVGSEQGNIEDTSSEFHTAMTQIFDMYDTNGDGTIVADELATMVTELMDARLEAQGEPHKSQIESRINLDAAKLLIKALDTDGDKKLNLSEFCSLMTNAAVENYL